MSAIVIPFAPRRTAETPTTPKRKDVPLVVRTNRWGVDFVGTKAQLTAWEIAEESHFPIKPKRVAYNGKDEPVVSRLKGGGELFLVRTHCYRDETEKKQQLERLAQRIVDTSSAAMKATTAMLAAVEAWRLEMITREVHGELQPVTKAIDELTRAAYVIACERPPPDETEPEHER